ncbi:hypothetical protein J437_LFUL019317 [Ladona fulva]|uniref:Uncharacterized protein n=1 Tax=Ladona fulva TaxID=123851 RepID=A0A8K0KRE0_LADFU|nr:hypothetical protein J437_LFUL019317 [Ladona fulva]
MGDSILRDKFDYAPVASMDCVSEESSLSDTSHSLTNATDVSLLVADPRNVPSTENNRKFVYERVILLRQLGDFLLSLLQSFSKLFQFPVLLFQQLPHSGIINAIVAHPFISFAIINIPFMSFALARSGQNPPEGFMAPKAWKVLAEYYKSLQAK